MKEEREITRSFGVEWAPGDQEFWPSEELARKTRDVIDPDARLFKMTEIKEYID